MFVGQISNRMTLFKRLISLFVIQTFIFSNIAMAAPQSDNQDISKPQTVLINPDKIVIPRDEGLIKSKFTGNGTKLVIHIQDAHCNYEAQSNIARIIENLVKNYSLSLVSVEGADGLIDTTWFKAFPDEEVRKEVATYFMKKGEITGPEYLSITTNYSIRLFGAETRSYYIENLNAFTSSYPMKGDTEKYFNTIKAALNKLKDYVYSAELKAMDTKAADYESKKIQFNDYIRFLQEMAEKNKINLRQYENLFKLVNVLSYEKRIDFNVTDKERNALIDELSKKLSREAITELVAKSMEFKVGRLSSSEYYYYLRNLAMSNDIDVMARFPNLYNYIIYNAVYSKIENEKLFHDIREVETAIKEKLFKNDDQRTLEKLSRHIDILLGLVNIKLLNGDFDYYKSRKSEFSHEAFTGFINKKAGQYGLVMEIDAPAESVANSIPKLEDFYAIAVKRDKALVENTLKEMDRQKLEIAVLVTGGFHSEGMAKLLENQGISYMVVCPTITKDVPSPYIQILTNQRTPIDEILTAQPDTKKGMLAPYLISRAISLNRKELDKLSKELVGDPVTGRVHVVKDRWVSLHVEKWLNRALAFAGSHKLGQDMDVMKEAYTMALETRLQTLKKQGLLPNSIDIKKYTADIMVNPALNKEFELAYKKLTAVDIATARQTSGAKSFPARKSNVSAKAKAAPQAAMAAATVSAAKSSFNVIERRKALLEIFGNDEKLFKEYLEKAKGSRGVDEDEIIMQGMFNAEDKAKLEILRITDDMKPAGPPAGKKVVMSFGGGTASLASIKPLVKLGAFVRSIQSSVDDGGSTNKMVVGLRNKGYGWMPAPGDLANSLFKGSASQDKLFKLLDDQGRISKVSIDAVRGAKTENKAYNQAKLSGKDKEFNRKQLPIMDRVGKSIKVGKIIFYGENGDILYLDSFSELCKMLLARIVDQAIIKKRGIGYTEKTTALEDDFVYFSAGILNVAELMDKDYFKIIQSDGASIRNLVLLAAVDYVGLIRAGYPKYEEAPFTPLLSEDGAPEKFQLAVDLMAKFGNVEDRESVSLSHTDPETLYTIHRDNVILIEAKPGKWSKEKKDWVIKPALYTLVVNVSKSRIEVKIPELGQTKALDAGHKEDTVILRVGNAGIKVKIMRNDDGNFAFKVKNSDAVTLIEPEEAIENTRVEWGKEEKDHLVATDGTGMIRYTIKLPEDGKPGEYEYEPLNMSGKKVYIRSRFTAMQTHITETANYSKIVETGFVEKDPVEIEMVDRKPVYRFKPSLKNRAKPNRDVLNSINDPRTDGIIFGPGSFITSIMPHFLTKGLPEALRERRKKGNIPMVLVINPSIDNETADFSIEDMLKMIEETIERVSGQKIRIDEMFTDIVINKFDTTKLEDYFAEKDAGLKQPLSARWYVNRVLENPELIDELGLTYFRHLINKFLGFTDMPLHALSSPQKLRFSVLNDDGTPIVLGDDESGYEKEINLAEYLEYKIGELLKTLREKPRPEIRTDPGKPSKEAKKSRGPVLYNREYIRQLKKEYPGIRVYRDLFMAGVDFAAPRETGKPTNPTISFLPDYTSYVLGEIFGLTELNKEVAQAYDRVVRDLPAGMKEDPRDRGFFRYIFNVRRPYLTRLLTPEAHAYFSQLSLDGFRRVIDSVHISDNLEKNSKGGYGLTLVAGLPFGEGSGEKARFAKLIKLLQEKIKDITNNRVKFYDKNSTRLTVTSIVRTQNFEKDDPTSMQEALDKVKKSVEDLNDKWRSMRVNQESENIDKTIGTWAGCFHPFAVKISGLEYDTNTGNIQLIVKPATEKDKAVFEDVLLNSLFRLPIENRDGFHISLGYIERPLDRQQIEELNSLFGKLELNIPSFRIESLKAVLYKNRSLQDYFTPMNLPLNGEYSGHGVGLSFNTFFDAASKEINELAAKQAAAAKVDAPVKPGAKAFPARKKAVTAVQAAPANVGVPLDVPGRLFLPALGIEQGKPIPANAINTTRTAEEVLARFERAEREKREISIDGHLRGIDGPGSSLDIPPYVSLLTDEGLTDMSEIPMTVAIASEFGVKIRFERAKNTNAIEYVAPDYGITEASPYIVEGPIVLNQNGRTPNGQKDAPAYIFSNLFGLRGVRIVCDEISPIALAGGMESSSVFNIALIAAASTLSGADLSYADMASLAVKLDNDEFGSVSGEQGALCAITGNAYNHIFLAGIKDADGNPVNPYGAAYSAPLTSEEELKNIERHTFLVQAGKVYKEGKAKLARTSTLINIMWTNLLTDHDAVGFALHKEKPALAAQYAAALQDGNFEKACETINRYVDIRDELCRRWIGLALDAHAGKDVPEYAKEYARKVFDQNHPDYRYFDVIRELYNIHGETLRNMSLYSFEPIQSLIAEARREGIAIMPLGAGGPGANLMAISPKGAEHLKSFFEARGINKFTSEQADEARKLIRGEKADGEIKGYLPFRAGRESLRLNGFSELDFKVPELPPILPPKLDLGDSDRRDRIVYVNNMPVRIVTYSEGARTAVFSVESGALIVDVANNISGTRVEWILENGALVPYAAPYSAGNWPMTGPRIDIASAIIRENSKRFAGVGASLPAINPTTTEAWKNLTADFENIKSAHLRDLFKNDSTRARRFSEAFVSGDSEIYVDYSKNRINDDAMRHLLQLAYQAHLSEAIQQMFSGEKINATENRAVLHAALRIPRDQSLVFEGNDVIPDVRRVLDHMKQFSEAINSGEWKGYTGKPITDIVNIGIGGSDLGPVMVTEALRPYATGKVNVHFVSNVDGTDITEKVIKRLNPETTLFMIASKTFTTQETITNAETAKRWFLEHAKDREAVKKHFVAISTNKEEVEKFGIDTANMFEFWDWVGGRYSLWSAIGLSIATYIGFDNFQELLSGAHDMDKHFRKEPFEHNIPIILALMDIWYTNFFGAETHAILPYDQYLHRLPAYLQQAFMESNGKSVDRNGNPIGYVTSPVIWGEAGTNGQHSFYQKIHQGGRVIPADFIGISNSQNPQGDHHEKLISNFFAQTKALAFGKTMQEVLAEGVKPEMAPHQVFNGNNPTNAILINKLSPRALGALIAMYEHQIFTEGVILNIYSFDQWGVELGKKEAKPILNELKGKPATVTHDSSTLSLLDQYKAQSSAGRSGAKSFPAGKDTGHAAHPAPNSLVEDIDSAITQVESSTRQMALHNGMQYQDGFDLRKTIFVMKSNLQESILAAAMGKKADGTLKESLLQRYRVMEQQLNRFVLENGSANGIVRVNRDDFISTVTKLIGEGNKVIVLDDGELTEGLNPNSLAGVHVGVNFCAITAEKRTVETGVVPFVNLNAMAMMGVGILHDDSSLFEAAYMTFTGNRPPDNVMSDFMSRLLFIVRALPRIVKLTGNVDELEKMNRMFAVAA